MLVCLDYFFLHLKTCLGHSYCGSKMRLLTSGIIVQVFVHQYSCLVLCYWRLSSSFFWHHKLPCKQLKASMVGCPRMNELRYLDHSYVNWDIWIFSVSHHGRMAKLPIKLVELNSAQVVEFQWAIMRNGKVECGLNWDTLIVFTCSQILLQFS